ncbi:PAS domain S-box protein, partial [Rhodoferax sp.]|uniref:PAS domain S-box protein n=1 Tax=Rhodoferax sp. TaxID=50421 RepID=UPI00274A328C|nr:PAS domain S-box protein [Rhodoferax sp.]
MLADRTSILATQRKFFALLALLALLLPLTGWVVVRIHGPQVEREAHMQLTAIARLKAEQIETWLGERHRDGHVLVTSPDFVRQVIKLVAAAASASASAPGLVRAERDAIVIRFNQLRQAYDYDSLDLIDVRGGALVSTGRPATLPPTFDSMVVELQEGGLMPLADVAVGATGEARLRWLLPVFDSNGPMRRLLALVMVHSSPEQFLFPVIQTWPTSSPSGETLLVTREGDSAVFMNSLRHRSGTAMNLRLPMADPVLPAAVALKDKQPGVVNGVDYRQVPVVAAYRPVAGTPWRVVAKLDRDEVMAPVRVLAWWVSGVTALAILAVAAVLALFWRQLRRTQRFEVLAEKAKSDELMSRFFTLPFIGIATGDVGGATWGRVNDHFCAITGYSRDALRGRGWIDLVDAPDWQQDVAGFECLMRGEIDHYEAERRIHRGDRTEAFVSLHWRALPDAGRAEPRCIMMLQDITQRRLAEQKARRQTCLYAALSECNQAIVQCTERGELFNRICQTAVVLGDMRMAWVGLRDLATQRVLPVAAFGAGIDALSNIDVSASADTALGRGAVGTAIREDRPVWIQDFLGSPATAPWHAIGERVGWRSVAAIPLHSQGQVVGVFMLVSGELDGFDAQAQQLLVEMAGDVSFALDNFEHEAQRQRAEQLLQRSQTQLELALKGSSDAPWDWDLVEHRLEYSPQGWHMLGFGAHEIPVGPGLWQALVHPQDLPLIDGLQQQVYQTGASVTAQELRLRHKAGHYVPVLARGFVTRDESGWPVRITGTNMDLTAQHQARQVDSLRPFTLDLMASGLDIDQVVQRLLQRLEELLPERLTAVWLLDAQTGVVEPGPCAALAPMLAQARDGGVCADVAQGADAAIVFDPPHAHAPLPHDCALRAALQALACKRDWVQRRCWPVLSSRAQVLGVLDLFDKTSVALGEHETALVDMVCHLLGIAIERKAAQAQERLAAQVFSQSRDGITITDARGDILLVNRAFSTITGYPESEVLGKNPRLMSSGRHGRDFYAAMWDAIRTDGMWQGEIWNRRKNGEVYPQWLTINRMNGVHGEVTHYVAIFTDISQKKSDEERIKWMAHFDPLTGLPNRALLTDRFSHALSM